MTVTRVVPYVLPVLCMTSFFIIMDSIAAYCYSTAASLQRRALAHAPAAWYWFRSVVDDGGHRDWTSPSCKGERIDPCRFILGDIRLDESGFGFRECIRDARV